MCGIAGYINFKQKNKEQDLRSIILHMTERLKHRGPDDQGIWIDAEHQIAFGQRRLSIIDLSPLGHQPYLSDDKTYILNFNGEIYNFLEIRKELEGLGHQFKSHTDTEVLLKALVVWGIDQALLKLNGMFAFSFLDLNQKILYLVRDRMGVKPLYWFQSDEGLGFASELKALRCHPDFKKNLNYDAAFNYFRFGFIPGDLSIYENCQKITQGHYLKLDLNTQHIDIHQYWHMPKISMAKDPSDTIGHLHDLLKEAVRLRMIADVPLGSLLSGGIDSALITALMQSQSSTKIKTFSIGFSSQEHNEAPFAEAIAQHLGTDHKSLYVSARDGLELIPRLAAIYDEPFGDSSAIPTLLLSRLVKEHVTVALSGDGGDEVFLGYNRYPILERFQTFWNWPNTLKKAFLKPLTILSPDTYDKMFNKFDKRAKPKMLGDKIHKFSRSLIQSNYEDLYAHLFGQWAETEHLVRKGARLPLHADRSKSPLQAIRELDLLYYLPDDILTKVDKASMAYGLEARSPFLDYRVVSYAHSMPQNLLLNDYTTKWALRKILAQYIPKKLFERPKSGFSIPLKDWLHNDLKSYVEDSLYAKNFRSLGFLNHNVIQKTWIEFLNGRSEHVHRIWTILMFAQWAEENAIVA